MDKLQTMSDKELSRLEIMQRLKEKRLSQAEAAKLMGLGIRQVKRLWRKYGELGAAGLISQRRGRPSHNRLDAQVIQRALDLIQQRYADFGPTLAHEKLVELHRLKLSVESVRQLMIREGIWKPKKARKLVAHPMRQRRACSGELIQIDGSDDDWLEGRGPRCTLLVFVDDATGQLAELWFVPHESFFGYCEASRHYFERYGKPLAFYSDKHGIFHMNHPQDHSELGLTQFGRAMQELDIQIICANTPQAKGRVERANQTLQDRLIKELRLQGIATLEAANAFLPQFRADFNARFAVPPRSTHNAHRPLRPSDDLDRILSLQESRTLTKNLTVQFNKVVYQIQTQRPTYALQHAKVTVCENAQGQVLILYKGKPLAYTVFRKQTRQAKVVPAKSIDFELRYAKMAHSPAPDHPWRKHIPTPLLNQDAPLGDISTLD